jgi:hypothetical protein
MRFGWWYNCIESLSMKIAILICCILALVFLALAGLSYTAGISLEVSVTDIDNGVIIQNVGNTPCLVVVNSLEGEQQFELAVGASVTLVTLSHITGTTGVLAFGSATVRVDLGQIEKMEKAHEKWVKIKYDLSSNLTDP